MFHPQGLRDTPVAEVKSAGSKASAAEDTEMQEMLVALYRKHGGDLDEIFKELKEDPGKAKKYPPEGAEQFAEKYRKGGYSYIKDEAAAESK